jgi:hypothetical protein
MAQDRKNTRDPRRAARLSEALRENLRRRKQQARDRDQELDDSRKTSPDRDRGEPDKT